ncbi:MAG TPA: exodeoxyribonuclease V subunit alpha, partial [Gammaproteobacteria bacterium]|nr:exodeoxyribonuclease V subunit alpha [Gammaproteobacteria bacterium]
MIWSKEQCDKLGLSELAYQFGSYIRRQAACEEEVVAWSAACLSEVISQGKRCLNYQQLSLMIDPTQWAIHSDQHWQQQLHNSKLVSDGETVTPLVLTSSGELYLYRQWQQWQYLHHYWQQRLALQSLPDPIKAQASFAAWASSVTGTDWQKVAVIMALMQPRCVISGGPGTGKTTITMWLLKFIQQQYPDWRIALATPTGKAAMRLQSVLKPSQQITVKTLHRLLKITVQHPQGRYNRGHPLPLELLIIDEASMIDNQLMTTIFQSLSSHTRLILLGDGHQLAAIETGGFFAELSNKKMQFSASFCQQFTLLTGQVIESNDHQNAAAIAKCDNIVTLQHNYRFQTMSTTGELAVLVQQGQAEQVISYLNTLPNHWLKQETMEATLAKVIALYQPFFEALANQESAEYCLALLEKYRVLCAIKQGQYGTVAINNWLQQQLPQQSDASS